MSLSLFAQSYQMAVLKYNGGGDYYANPTALPNLIKFCNSELGMNISKEVPYVEVGSTDLFQYPLIHMTGHGNVVFSKSEDKISGIICFLEAFYTSTTTTVWTVLCEQSSKKYFRKQPLQNCLQITPFSRNALNSRMDCLKFMNMTASDRKLLELSSMVGWFVFTPTKRIFPTVGKIRKYTTTHLKKDVRPYKWVPILFRTLFRTECSVSAGVHRARCAVGLLHLLPVVTRFQIPNLHMVV